MNWVLLIKAPDLIQRDSLVHRLGEEHIEVMTPDRDMIIDVGGGPNLTLGGYSAFFDGYSVLVQKKDLAKAQDVVKAFEPLHLQKNSEVPDYMTKYYYSSILTVFAPFILHVTGFYHLFKAIQLGQFRFTIKFLMATAVSALTLFAVVIATFSFL